MSKQENTTTPEEQSSLDRKLLAAFTSSTVDVDKIKEAIELGADVNAREEFSDFMPVLVMAVARKNERAVSELIERGADVNAEDSRGNTAIHQLALSPSMSESARDIFEALKNAGANLNFYNNKLFTPLIMAAEKGNKDLCEMLLNQPDVVRDGFSKDVSLLIAARLSNGRDIGDRFLSKNQEIFKLLLERGADSGSLFNESNEFDRVKYPLLVDTFNEYQRMHQGVSESHAGNSRSSVAALGDNSSQQVIVQSSPRFGGVDAASGSVAAQSWVDRIGNNTSRDGSGNQGR